MQALGRELCTTEVEDRNLLAGSGDEGCVAPSGDEDAMVGVNARHDTLAEVLDEQADVAQRVVVASACSPHDSNIVDPSFGQVFHGLGLVVGLLTRRDNDARGVLLANVVGNRVAVANNDVEGLAGGHVAVGRTVADDNGVSLVEHLERQSCLGVLAIAEHNG